MGRPTTLPSPWKELATAYGGVGKLAEAIGVDTWTISRWASGKFAPRPVIQKSVNALAKRRRLDVPFPGVA